MALNLQGAQPIMDSKIKHLQISNTNGMCDEGFTKEIQQDLEMQGYKGEALLAEMKRVQGQIRPAVKLLIREAKAVAKEARKNPKWKNKTAEIFADIED